jgi:hypothetical protein
MPGGQSKFAASNISGPWPRPRFPWPALPWWLAARRNQAGMDEVRSAVKFGLRYNGCWRSETELAVIDCELEYYLRIEKWRHEMQRLFRVWPLVAVLAIVTIISADASFATCTGSDPCNACKNCKYCAHCAKQGGKCGVCK